jgi:LPS export ABC transporter protein LptC
MRAPSVKTLRWITIGVIFLVLLTVFTNYFQQWIKRTGRNTEVPQMLSSEMTRSADQIEYSEYRLPEGVVRFRIRARRLLETRLGKNLLQDIEAYDFNPDGSIRNEIRSQKAEYDQEKKLADFSGDVKIFFGKGVELRTNSLHYNLNTNTGTTQDRLELFSPSIKGTAHGISYDQESESLDLGSNVNFTFTRGNPEDAAQSQNLHAMADRAHLSQSAHRALFQGNASLESDSGVLSGQAIEISLSPDQKRVTSMSSSGDALYRSNNPDEEQTLSGERMIFGINAASGALDKISVSGQAVFSSAAPNVETELRAGKIDIDLDAAKNVPKEIQGETGVRFKMKRGDEQTFMAGGRLISVFAPNSKNLESIQINQQASLKLEGSNSPDNELQADEIRIGMREISGRAAFNKLRANGGAQWISKPSQAGSGVYREPDRTLSASFLEMVFAEEGNTLNSVNAVGNIVMTENPAESKSSSEQRKLYADRAQFGFFPANGRLKDMSGDGNIRIIYKRRNAASPSKEETLRTSSDKMKATFVLKEGQSYLTAVSQWGRFTYHDADNSAASGRCDYDAEKGLLVLKEAPKITMEDRGQTTGETAEYDKDQKMLSVHGKVRSVLSSKKNDTSLFGAGSSSSPSVVLADQMQYWMQSERARYSGKVQLLSESGQLQAGMLESLKGGEIVEAEGEIRHLIPAGNGPDIPGQTRAGRQPIPSKTDRNSPDMPITIQSSGLKYVREKNTITYREKVALHARDFDLFSNRLVAVLNKEGKKIDHATAYEKVLIRQGERECKGDLADWDPEKFVVTGAPAEVSDPVKGRSYARRLTSFIADDTIRLEK